MARAASNPVGPPPIMSTGLLLLQGEMISGCQPQAILFFACRRILRAAYRGNRIIACRADVAADASLYRLIRPSRIFAGRKGSVIDGRASRSDRNALPSHRTIASGKCNALPRRRFQVRGFTKETNSLLKAFLARTGGLTVVRPR